MSKDADSKTRLDRRTFIRSSAVLAAMPMVVSRGAGFFTGGDEIKVGLVGCGGRGTGAALQALRADEGTVLTAMADIFSDHLEGSLGRLQKAIGDRAGHKIRVPKERRFLGFDAYEKLIASGVDVVILTTPPGFRPEHLAAAVAADKHVFCEKPVAVDAPGVRSVLKTVEEARRKKLCLMSGFCWRYSARERETFKRINQGALGQVHTVYTTYLTSPLRIHPRQPGWSDTEWQLRNWQHFDWLAGDHIVEQAVHSIDKMAWALNGELPEKCVAVGGRIARVEPERGNIYDHFSVTYEFKSGARGFHMCRQIAGCANDNSDLIMGTDGVCEINGWAPRHVIRGKHPWRCKTKRNDMYQQEHDELFAAIRSGEPVNDGVWMTHSVLMAIMGRMAAYTGKVVTWEEALNSKQKLGPDKLEWGPLEMNPVPIPGKTRLI